MTQPPDNAKPIRVVITYRVCQHWRVPVFERLSQDESLDLTVLHGSSVPKTKLVNGKDLSAINHIQHRTIKWPGVDFVFHPFLFLFTLAYTARGQFFQRVVVTLACRMLSILSTL